MLRVLKCLLRPCAQQKDLAHMEQQVFLLCDTFHVFLSQFDQENALVHKEQVNGFSSV